MAPSLRFPVRESDWSDFVRSTSERFGLRAGDSMYEVGCGSGAFLLPLREAGLRGNSELRFNLYARR